MQSRWEDWNATFSMAVQHEVGRVQVQEDACGGNQVLLRERLDEEGLHGVWSLECTESLRLDRNSSRQSRFVLGDTPLALKGGGFLG
jgi:hypothetical protein